MNTIQKRGSVTEAIISWGHENARHRGSIDFCIVNRKAAKKRSIKNCVVNCKDKRWANYQWRELKKHLQLHIVDKCVWSVHY